jgi:hypothetical protein
LSTRPWLELSALFSSRGRGVFPPPLLLLSWHFK